MTSPNNFFQSEGEATYLEVGVVDMLKDQGGCPGLKTQKVCVFNVLQPQQTMPATTSIHPLHEAMEAKQTNQPRSHTVSDAAARSPDGNVDVHRW